MITNNYYGIAINDYKYFVKQLKLESYNHTAIQAQQVVEKLLKHLVAVFCVGHVEANDALNKHSLKKINAILKESDINLSINLKDLTFLQDYSFDARYPGYDFVEVSKEEADMCVGIVEEVKKKVQDYMTEKGYCIKCGMKLTSTGQCTNLYCG